jgi:cellulose synthase/poly-beta-1,6-N-acetylglucosamine synthase-like glycosyltransferase
LPLQNDLPPADWTYTQAREELYGRDWYKRAWFRKLVFLVFIMAIEAAAYAITFIYLQDSGALSWLSNLFQFARDWLPISVCALFGYVITCIYLEDFFLIQYWSKAFAWWSWGMFVGVLVCTGAAQMTPLIQMS